MRLVRGSRYFIWSSLGVALFAGGELPDRDPAPPPDSTLAALVDPTIGGVVDQYVTTLAKTRAAALPDQEDAATAAPIILALADPGIAVRTDPNVKMGPSETRDECLGAEACIDQYLWSVYQRAPKLDTIKVPERKRVTVKKKGKTRTVTKTFIKLVDEDFTWKDPKAAEKAGMPLMQYVIGGIDRGFKLKLYRVLRAMDEAGLEPGITSGFRDDYRQAIASGNKAASDSSYHGGSRRGGYGHGLAADLVSVKGATRSERWASSELLWKWIDAHGKEFGIGRPYLDRDPPHVAPTDGKEYASHRGGNTRHAEAKKRRRAAASGERRGSKRART